MAYSPTLRRLHVENFRSHQRQDLDFGQVTILVGPNGVGKTNLLEAIWYLATTRPFRTSRDIDVINWQAASACVRGDQFEIRLVREAIVRKALLIDGVPRRPLEYLGELRAVLFTPDSLAILAGPPRERRRFLDTLLAQGDRASARDLVNYRRLIGQRNALLRLIHLGRAQPAELEPWNSQLVQVGSRLTARRAAAVAVLALEISKNYHWLGGAQAETLTFTYQPTGSSDPAVFADRLQANLASEIALAVTLVGPHRDDLSVSLRGHPLAEHGSRGEIRTILLAVKWAEFAYLAHGRAVRPIVLLDDLFSELDLAHRQAVTSFLETSQAVVTTTDVSHIPKELQKKATIIHLEDRGFNERHI